MKNKMLIGVVSAAGLSFTALLTGCTTENSQENESIAQLDTATSVNFTEEPEQSEAENEEDMAHVSEGELEQSEKVAELEKYEELSSQDYFDPEAFQVHLITDNPGTRVFIFHDGEQLAYKTVFIKHENRLKVIDLVNDTLLMNGVI